MWEVFCGRQHLDNLPDKKARRLRIEQEIEIEGARNPYRIVSIDDDSRLIFVVELR